MPLVNARYKRANPDWLLIGSPAGTYAASCRKTDASVDLAIAATGVELAVDIALDAGDLVTSVTWVTGATAAGTPTAGYLVLRDSAGAKLVQSADFGSTARAANTAYTSTVTTPYQVTAGGLYRIGISFTAGTVPTLRGISMANAAVCAVGRANAVTHGAAVGAVAPATVATPTTVFAVPYFLVA